MHHHDSHDIDIHSLKRRWYTYFNGSEPMQWHTLSIDQQTSINELYQHSLENGDVKWVDRIAQHYFHLVDHEKDLFIAVEKGYDDVVAWFLNNGISPNYLYYPNLLKRSTGWMSTLGYQQLSPLMQSITLKKSLPKLTEKSDLSITNDVGLNGFHQAILDGNEYVFKQGMRQLHSEPTQDGFLPIELVCYHQPSWIDVLMKQPLKSLNPSNIGKIGPLLSLELKPTQYDKIWQWLIRSCQQNDQLIYAIDSNWLFKQNDLQIKRLIQQSASWCYQDNRGNNFIALAIIHERPILLRWLLSQKNIDVNQFNDYHATPLMIASIKGDIIALRALLKEPDIQVNQINKLKYSALHWAVTCSNDECVKILLNHRECQPFTENIFCQMPLDQALLTNNKNIIDLFDQKRFRDHVHHDHNEVNKMFQRLSHYVIRLSRWY